VTSVLAPVRDFVADNGAKILRYCGASVVNVLNGMGLLAFCLEVLELSPVPAQITASMVSAIPAYLLSRRWVWKQTGRDSFRNEVFPFWVMSLIGLVFATSAIALAERFTQATVLLLGTSFCAYGVVWVAKFLVFDKILWRQPTEPDATVT